MVSTLATFIQNYTGGHVKFNNARKNVINIGKTDVKFSLFTDHTSVHGENSKESRDEILVTNLTKLLDTEPIYKKIFTEFYLLATKN